MGNMPKKIIVKCVDCHRDIEITEPAKNEALIFGCTHCGTTNTFEHYVKKDRDPWDD